MTTTTYSNINLLWGELIIEELNRLGIRQICVAPGSRSTPLTVAAANHPNIEVIQHFDERGLGFLALGLAKAQQTMVAVITTSGTAVANLLPAVVEAKQGKVPLLVLSADRPVELIDCGANQAIKQTGIYANFVLDALNLPSASCDVIANYLLKSIDMIVSKGIVESGPIQINAPFKEPFYPNEQLIDYSDYLSNIGKWQENSQPYSQPTFPNRFLDSGSGFNIKDKRGIVVIGNQATQSRSSKLALISWAEQQGWPVFCDCQSSIKDHPFAIGYYDQLLHRKAFTERCLQADVIIQFGGQLISKRLLSLITTYEGDYYLVDEQLGNIDPTHSRAQHLNVSNQAFLSFVRNQQAISWVEPFLQHNKDLQRWLNSQDLPSFTELSVTQALGQLIPRNSNLFLANSMPVRLFDMYASTNKPLSIYTNRGASGIDGLLATFCGIALGKNANSNTMVIGDTSLLHDLNSLALLKYVDTPTVIVIFNNDGGAIFNLLPVPGSTTILEQHYQLPHGLSFAHAARMFAVNYQAISSISEFSEQYQNALNVNAATILELGFPRNETTDLVKQLAEKLQNLAKL